MLGRAGWLPWPRPKPVTPQHLETITGNNDHGAGGLAAQGLQPRLSRRVKEHRACRHLLPPPPPPMFALASAHTVPDGPSCQEKSAPSCRRKGCWPGWVSGSLDRSQQTPAQLPALLARPLAQDWSPVLWASVFQQGAWAPPWPGWLFTTHWHVSDQLGTPAQAAPRGPAVLYRPQSGEGPTSSHHVHLPHLPRALHAYLPHMVGPRYI